MLWRSALLPFLALVGCARGVSDDVLLDAAYGPINMGDSGTLEAAAPSPGQDSGSNGVDAAPDDASTDDAGSDGRDASAPASCQAANTCDTALVVSSVRGDTGSDTRMTSGSQSQWLSVKVSDTTLVGTTLSVGITLTSQGGANYDLFVLQPDERGGHNIAPKDCAASPISSQNVSGADTVKLSWDDVINSASDTDGDGLVIAIEVRHVSGPCGTWNLTIAGND